jgi:DNA-binding NarL/FixJ family response regulator
LIRFVLADDQPIVRTGLARILGARDGFELVAECGNGQDALTAVAALEPDLVVMDLRMPGMDGIEATRAVAELRAAPPVLILTTFDEDELVWGALHAGASGMVLKDAGADVLIAAARAVAAGAAWFDPAVAPRILHAWREMIPPHERAGQRLAGLTEREHDVLRLIARGLNNAEIAGTLHVSEATVKTHVGAIFTKLDLRDRPAAIVFAFDHRVVVPTEG